MNTQSPNIDLSPFEFISAAIIVSAVFFFSTIILGFYYDKVIPTTYDLRHTTYRYINENTLSKDKINPITNIMKTTYKVVNR